MMPSLVVAYGAIKLEERVLLQPDPA
jgi:hypothetical protein